MYAAWFWLIAASLLFTSEAVEVRTNVTDQPCTATTVKEPVDLRLGENELYIEWPTSARSRLGTLHVGYPTWKLTHDSLRGSAGEVIRGYFQDSKGHLRGLDYPDSTIGWSTVGAVGENRFDVLWSSNPPSAHLSHYVNDLRVARFDGNMWSNIEKVGQGDRFIARSLVSFTDVARGQTYFAVAGSRTTNGRATSGILVIERTSGSSLTHWVTLGPGAIIPNHIALSSRAGSHHPTLFFASNPAVGEPQPWGIYVIDDVGMSGANLLPKRLHAFGVDSSHIHLHAIRLKSGTQHVLWLDSGPNENTSGRLSHWWRAENDTMWQKEHLLSGQSRWKDVQVGPSSMDGRVAVLTNAEGGAELVWLDSGAMVRVDWPEANQIKTLTQYSVTNVNSDTIDLSFGRFSDRNKSGIASTSRLPVTSTLAIRVRCK